MASTFSSSELAGQVLASCLAGTPASSEALAELTERALAADEETATFASRALFGVLVERLADLFEPRLCDDYAHIFSQVLRAAGIPSEGLEARYRQVRQVRPVTREPRKVIVLSRVTLGADVAITSIVLDAAKRRFPQAEIVFAGPEKAWQLFEKDERLRYLPVPYGRTAMLRDRLTVFPVLRQALADPDVLLLDPDSRLTQLGLLPVCSPGQHHLFESRAYGGDGNDSLPALTTRWVRETLGIDDAIPYLAPKFRFDFGSHPVIAVSFGVGENPAKRVGDGFEIAALKHLAGLGPLVMVDRGAGGEEGARVDRAVAECGAPNVGVHDGTFASFASLIAHAQLYAGYDSAGQHVAAALAVPLVSVFAGYVSPRMYERWKPDGPGPRTIIDTAGLSQAAIIERFRAAATL